MKRTRTKKAPAKDLYKFTKVSTHLCPENIDFLKTAKKERIHGSSYSALINDAVSTFREFCSGELARQFRRGWVKRKS